ncbi:hypothetical protein HD553DRAFT_353520 [Filobasidium floriforme]|uniref:uncharacterized protein n=1 Tax=Filobasidium floriforme TaxID=5210 RepID=UPI001E8EC829|nr:uncharacterized protein HD553DRAFT_353520 [Filobasidium floriforme]KAH8090308.1 hypothetical protein HD553DRAFT_353520 [Filobasidium floriforme]
MPLDDTIDLTASLSSSRDGSSDEDDDGIEALYWIDLLPTPVVDLDAASPTIYNHDQQQRDGNGRTKEDVEDDEVVLMFWEDSLPSQQGHQMERTASPGSVEEEAFQPNPFCWEEELSGPESQSLDDAMEEPSEDEVPSVRYFQWDDEESESSACSTDYGEDDDSTLKENYTPPHTPTRYSLRPASNNKYVDPTYAPSSTSNSPAFLARCPIAPKGNKAERKMSQRAKKRRAASKRAKRSEALARGLSEIRAAHPLFMNDIAGSEKVAERGERVSNAGPRYPPSLKSAATLRLLKKMVPRAIRRRRGRLVLKKLCPICSVLDLPNPPPGSQEGEHPMRRRSSCANHARAFAARVKRYRDMSPTSINREYDSLGPVQEKQTKT